ncbi:M1 family metallopeptidase [Algivirga pacifica]|uniref:Aminopeptidase N n=1 Tax=Algivirga pacifica TaxID=1162670 RepID=A0ABP9DR86_9BACT
MRKMLNCLFLWGGVLLTACSTSGQNKSQESKDTVDFTKDIHSFSEPESTVVSHLSLELKVDFEEQKLKGVAKLLVDRKKGNKLMLDTRLLTIQEVTDGQEKLTYTLHEAVPFLGSPLEIDLKEGTKEVWVYYETSPEAPAIQWLSPQQTAGKKNPFLFTQSQAILARSWVPIQDSPGVRFTYDAKVEVPEGLVALMSAENPQIKNDSGTYTFVQKKPIPAYLLALAVGDVTFQPLGKNIGVYAEPSMMKEAAYELGEMDQMMLAAEKLYGAYQWERYDVLFLPPSFPFGGMENPMLTFATPTIIAGDRSLTSLIAHELAHSWSGNLVTNATWNDFWLNEGFTVYFELRIMEEVYGKDFSDMLALISKRDLLAELEGMEYGEDTKLKLNLEGRDPDDGMNSIAYDKGFYFLKLCENTVGRTKWDAFLSKYFSEHAFQTITTEEFLTYLDENLLSKVDGAKETIKPDMWVYRNGLPDNCPEVTSFRYDQVKEEVGKFIEGTSASDLQTSDWKYFQEWEYFLSALPDALSKKQMKDLDKAFKFSQTGNNEIRFQWLMHVVKSEYTPAYPTLEKFLMKVGRRKFIAPIYKAMAQQEGTRALGQKIYQKARPNYHYVAVSTIDTYFAEQAKP